ncbi:PIN domain-containing protein [Natrinema gelatinilyticum]|uniref:PIN domain-containing protein n=1 Tax=Natrinema gelatinilyticum TaxID=2961571 RepID=UPI0020C23090|nr:PIN domain-containing protein [Natrinema gelatinilyticum]
MLLDSTFLNNLVRHDPDASDKRDELIDTETPIAISSLTVFEIGMGLRGDSKRYMPTFERVIDQIDEVPLGSQEAQRALDIQHNLLDRGEPIGAVDVLIAGTAATLSDPTVLTRNGDEFDRVAAIDVETY